MSVGEKVIWRNRYMELVGGKMIGCSIDGTGSRKDDLMIC